MNAETRPGFWKRLWLAFVRTLITGVLLLALVAGGYWAVREIQRSFDSVTARVSINRRDIEAIRNEIAARSAEVSDQERVIEALRDETDRLDTRLSDLRAEFSADLESQQHLLDSLEESVAASVDTSEAAMSRSQTSMEDTTALGTALVALQGDLNEGNSRIDALGGEIDALRSENQGLGSELEELNQSVEAVEETASNVNSMRQTLALYHVWELITRARLRLLENNVGLATNDVERAFRAVDALVADAPEDDIGVLQVMRTRLALAVNNLPGNPLSAAADLESAWDELEEILTARVLPPLSEVGAAETVPPATAEAPTPEPTPTPAP